MRAFTTPIVLLAAASLALTSCATTTEPTDTPAPGVDSTPAPSVTGVPAGDDTVLAIDAVATSTDGATLNLSLRVQRSLDEDDAEDDADTAELRSLLLENCGPDFVTEDLLDDDDWGLVRIDVSAQSTGESAWPTEEPISLVTAPRGTPLSAAITSSGEPLVTLEDPAGELGPCLVSPHLSGSGTAYAVLGISHDFDDDADDNAHDDDADDNGDDNGRDDDEGLFWNGYRFGFSSMVFGQENGVRFSDCVIQKTPLGEQLAAPEIGYEEESSETECSAGIPPVG